MVLALEDCWISEDAIAVRIVEEAIPQCKMRPCGKVNGAYAKPSKINAIAAGKACTNRILRLTVTAP
jgi:hypothetical protein